LQKLAITVQIFSHVLKLVEMEKSSNKTRHMQMVLHILSMLSSVME
jgi:hypothetical protein